MIIEWHAINLDATFDYNFFLSNFIFFIYILNFRPSLMYQEFLAPLTSTTHFFISTTQLPMALHYRDSYKRNKDDARPATMWKYRQFFATPKKQAKTKKKENCSVIPTNLLFPTSYCLTFLGSQSIIDIFA